MTMIKLAALNKESEDESRSEEEVTKEALEQIALQQYSKALELQRKENLADATKLLRDLLDTELLDGVKKPAPGEKTSGPLFNLKYLCYKNLASMLNAANDIDAAIEAYAAAADLDDSDITLWHRFGLTCLRGSRYEMALHAFQRGVERNPNHWPCLDKIVTLLMGLDFKEECISTIYDALLLDPGYMRGLVYRQHIYTKYPYIRCFMEYMNPIYKWDEKDEDPVDEEKAEKLLKEAAQIQEDYLRQQAAGRFKYVLPKLKLIKPVSRLTWKAVGDSLVHMHSYMAENYYSHACQLQMVFEIEEKDPSTDDSKGVNEVQMTESKLEENSVIDEDKDKTTETTSEDKTSENNDLSDKGTTEVEKVESDTEITPPDSEKAENNPPEPKKKAPTRRRGSALSFLEQWEWCNKRRSRRRTTVNKQDRLDNNIYDTLRRMIPNYLNPDTVHTEQNGVSNGEEANVTLNEKGDRETKETENYFGSENEQNDVKQFIERYSEGKGDIIEILQEYLVFLAKKWKVQWPEGLSNVFIEANKCYNSHISPPSTFDNDILQYVAINLLVEEFSVNSKLALSTEEKENQIYDLSVIESIGRLLNLKPHIFCSTDILEYMLRQLWVKLHIHMVNKCQELALDCLYQLTHQFEALVDEDGVNSYSLSLVNFSYQPVINQNMISTYIKYFERNNKLSTVVDLYERSEYDKVLEILTDSFTHCKDMDRKQEEEMPLDFAVQLSLILDSYWALDNTSECFLWALKCLHEALKHYFRLTSGASDYEKWTLTVVKILSSMEHILTTEGLSCLESVPGKIKSQGLEDLIRIIGHQVETNAAEMPFGTVAPWIIMHFILQREEDSLITLPSTEGGEEVPNPLMVLFIAHEQLGNRGWCCKNEGKLLYFILDTVVPRLWSPALSKYSEQVFQYMEQCVYCLFGHPARKNKVKYLSDHNVSPHTLDWKRAQQLYEIFRPPTLPALEGKISGLTADTENLFHRILALLPADCDPQKYVPEVEKYIKGVETKLPTIPPLMPYKMKDIYFLLGDYYFKKEEGKMAIKYNLLDVIVNRDRLESWAEISLAKAVNLERILNSCKNLNNEREYLNPAKATIRCFKRALELDPTHCNIWIEYGMFVYTVHSFCSRLLKQASESLSMEDFEALEKQKEDMLDTTLKCFTSVLNDLNSSNDSEKANEDLWLHYYMLGKVAEKRNRPPSEYLNYYLQGVKSLQETDATYPLKINYNSPTHLCIEVLELHYRIHASILKFIEQHENKPIPTSVGKVFATCIEEWRNGPFAKKSKKDCNDVEVDQKAIEPVHAANILKRSISDAGEEVTYEAKRLKMESAAAKVKRSASYDTERVNKDAQAPKSMKPVEKTSNGEVTVQSKKVEDSIQEVETDTSINNTVQNNVKTIQNNVNSIENNGIKEIRDGEQPMEGVEDKTKEPVVESKKESSSSSSSSSSSGSSSSEDTTDSSSSDSKDSNNSANPANDKPLPDEEIMKIVSACLDALEDCASRFPPHYKAIYRLAHYHFYYKRGKDIERCRDLMLSNFMSRSGQKLAGLFNERKHSNFFNNIWKIPLNEVDRAGGFPFHMSRSVLLTMEILKEIDDHKTLLDLSLHLQRIPEPDKKYLRDSDREELAQQAFSLCVQSLKGQLLKFSQQADLKSNDVERQALKSLMLDIYRAYQRAQKQPNSKQFTNLLIDAYKLVSTVPIPENTNLVDASMKFCQSLIQTLKQQATQASLDRSQNSHKRQTARTAVETTKVATTASQTKNDVKAPMASTSTPASSLPKMSAHEIASAFLPPLTDPVLTQQTAVALSYLNNISALAGYPAVQNMIHSSLNSFQAEFYRQFISKNLAPYNISPPKSKQKRGPKPGNPSRANTTVNSHPKTSKLSNNNPPTTSINKPTSSSGVTGLQKSVSAPLAPSMGTVLPSLPASMAANLSSFGAPPGISHTSSHNGPSQAHTNMVNNSILNSAIHNKPPLPHVPSTSGKTLQEKLAERLKSLPSLALSKLPSSITVTKSSVPKQPLALHKKSDGKKITSSGDSGTRPKPISSDEVIVLDDD
ncbi:calcineurin-binding protein cabin-1-like [Pectinophora gossypiella]|nr:calcineurin-binding protein cabin-1-like [Pectinophora gossypiella]